jgi:hypothetical protein
MVLCVILSQMFLTSCADSKSNSMIQLYNTDWMVINSNNSYAEIYFDTLQQVISYRAEFGLMTPKHIDYQDEMVIVNNSDTLNIVNPDSLLENSNTRLYRVEKGNLLSHYVNNLCSLDEFISDYNKRYLDAVERCRIPYNKNEIIHRDQLGSKDCSVTKIKTK